MKKRRQHYVWKKYLEPWCSEGKVWCYRIGAAPFHTNPINVAVERDFYQISQLSKGDIEFVQRVFIDPIESDTLRGLNAGWVSTFDEVFQLESSLRETEWMSAESQKILEDVMHNLDEDHYQRIEQVSESHLESLKNGDATFYEDDESAVDFAFFLASQYFRTKKIRDNVLRSFKGVSNVEVSAVRAWPVLRHIFTTCVAFNLYHKRDEYKLVQLKNESDLEFFTSDQPVLNVHSVGQSGEMIDDIEFYYPVSPNRALIISNDEKYRGTTTKEVSQADVPYFNNLVLKSAYEQVFSKNAVCPSLDRFVNGSIS